MRYTVHVMLGNQLYLVDCGLTNAVATDIINQIEALGFKIHVSISGSNDEPVGSPMLHLSELKRFPASPLPGRCAA